LFILSLLLTVGCASGTRVESPSAAAHRADLITRTEIERGPQTNALELVRALRPHWIGSVYLDGYRLGTFDDLRQITVPSVESIEYIKSVEAMARYGLTNPGNVLLVTSRNH
jgi:hypothetical protein